MGFTKCNEDDFERYVERLSSKGLNMQREWTCHTTRADKRNEEEDTHEKRR